MKSLPCFMYHFRIHLVGMLKLFTFLSCSFVKIIKFKKIFTYSFESQSYRQKERICHFFIHSPDGHNGLDPAKAGNQGLCPELSCG